MDLKDIFEKQIELNSKINPSFYSKDLLCSDNYKRGKIIQFELAMRQECSELIDSLNWKWWKKDVDDWDNVKIELIDILHFWVSMCTIVGMDSEDVIELYFKKNKLNHKRSNEGYAEGTYDKYKNGIEDNRSI